jgi:hypothetical protein|tara:strand:- start:734 stop:1165 length:432 start_codon:yes stop_codon:yes gene_type:complete
MITLDDIKSQWAEDSKLDNDLLDNESTKIPQLHSKYLNYLSDVRLIKIRKEQEYKTLIREKFEYYTGKADDIVYQENPFDLKVLKQDVPMYMDADPEIQNITTRINYYEEIIFFLEKVIQQLNNRTFQIKNSIEWQKFMQGSV